MMLTYEEWYELNESELNCLFAETGADREMDFDIEDEISKLYEQYVDTFGMEGSDVYCLGNGYIVRYPVTKIEECSDEEFGEILGI